MRPLVTSAAKLPMVKYAIVSEKQNKASASGQPTIPTLKPTNKNSGAPRMLRRHGI